MARLYRGKWNGLGSYTSDIAGYILPVLRMKAVIRSLNAKSCGVSVTPPQNYAIERLRCAKVYGDPGFFVRLAFPISRRTAIGGKMRGMIVVRRAGLIGCPIQGNIASGSALLFARQPQQGSTSDSRHSKELPPRFPVRRS